MTSPRASPALAPLLVFLAAALYFFAGTTGRDLWTTGEHRYAEASRVLTAEGHDHLVPHLNGNLYPDKPPLFFWLAGAPHRFLGADLPTSARLPSILGGAFTVMLTFLLGRRWYGTAAGLAAAGVLATTDLFDWASRMAHLDAFLTAIITSALYCFVRADATPRAERAPRNLWTALGFLAVGAGILVKGPPAPAVPGITILVFLLWTAPREILTPRLLWGTALAILPGAVWAYAAASDAGWDYLDSLVRGHAIAHAAGDIDKQEPWYFYLWNVPVHLLPWMLLVPAAVGAALASRRAGEERSDRFLVAWLVAPWVLFSFSVAKRDLYMVPVHPAAALLVARLFRDASESGARLSAASFRVPRRVLAWSAVVAGAGVAIAAVVVLCGADRGVLDAAQEHVSPRLAKWRANWEHVRTELTPLRLVLAVAWSGAIAAGGLVAARAGTAFRAGAGLVAAALSWNLLTATVLWPARDADQSPRAFLEEIRGRIGDAPLARLGGDGGLQYAVNWVLGRDRVDDSLWVPDRDRVNVRATIERASRYMADAPSEPRYLVTDARELERVGGSVPGAVEVLRRSRRRGLDIVLLGNAAAAGR